MTEDPVKDGLNWYQYVGSDPVNWVDLYGLKCADLGKGWNARVEGPHVPGDQKHVHLEYKGHEVWNQNEDGSPHHPDKLEIEDPPKKVKKS
jgi:hypothetical protein